MFFLRRTAISSFTLASSFSGNFEFLAHADSVSGRSLTQLLSRRLFAGATSGPLRPLQPVSQVCVSASTSQAVGPLHNSTRRRSGRVPFVWPGQYSRLRVRLVLIRSLLRGVRRSISRHGLSYWAQGLRHSGVLFSSPCVSPDVLCSDMAPVWPLLGASDRGRTRHGGG